MRASAYLLRQGLLILNILQPPSPKPTPSSLCMHLADSQSEAGAAGAAFQEPTLHPTVFPANTTPALLVPVSLPTSVKAPAAWYL